MATPQELALASFMAFQNSGSDPWGDMDRRRAEVAREQAEIDSRRDWVPVSGFDPFINSWEAKFVPPQRALDIENFQLQSEHPGARLIDDPFQYGFQRGMRAVAQPKPVAVKAPTSRNVGGNLLERNPITGEWEMKFAGQKKAVADDATKSRRALLEDRIKAKRRKIINTDEADKKTWQPLIDSVLADEAELEALLTTEDSSRFEVDQSTIPSGDGPYVARPQSRAGVDALDMFGQMGERTPFAFSGGSAPPPIQAPVRRRRYNPQTGRLE